MGTNGIGTNLQIGKETLWGTKVAGTQNLNFLNESFKMEPETLSEDTVIGSISAKAQDIVALNSSGGFELILKPENAISILSLAMGVAATPTVVPTSTTVYAHVLTPVDAVTSLPSFTACVFRKLHTKAYTGNLISTLELSAKSKDYARLKIETICKGEEAGTIVTGLPAPSKKAYIFSSGQFLIDTVAIADISSMTFKINNQISEGENTLGSGLYKSQGTVGLREFTISAETKYTAQAETLIETKYKTGTPIAVKLIFQSPELVKVGYPHTITIDMPAVMLTGGLPNISGKDEIKISLAGVALETGSVPCTITINSDITTAYI